MRFADEGRADAANENATLLVGHGSRLAVGVASGQYRRRRGGCDRRHAVFGVPARSADAPREIAGASGVLARAARAKPHRGGQEISIPQGPGATEQGHARILRAWQRKRLVQERPSAQRYGCGRNREYPYRWIHLGQDGRTRPIQNTVAREASPGMGSRERADPAKALRRVQRRRSPKLRHRESCIDHEKRKHGQKHRT